MSSLTDAPPLVALDMVIGGERRKAADGRTLETVDPTTARPWATIPVAGEPDVDAAVGAARAALDGPWGALSPTRRGRLLMRLADAVAEHAEELADLEVRENGKLRREMVAQARAVPDFLYYWGGMADKVEGAVIPLDGHHALNYTLRAPVGVVGVITPWNSPLFIAVWGLAPALAAGCTVVLKPSEVASAGVLRFAEIAHEAGLPPGVVNVVTGGPQTGTALVAHRGVSKVVFTGGTRTGEQVAATAGGHLAGVLLELGGKSPNIVFADADLDAAEAGVLAGIFGAAGQTCVAGSRALVEESVYDALLERLRRRADAVVVGDPRDPDTQMGPIATGAQLELVRSFVDAARDEGADVVSGGRDEAVAALPDGFFYRPTILAGLPPSARVVQEEVFGPVLTVLPFSGEHEAVELANATEFGLAAGIWTRDVKRAHRVAAAVEAGIVWINTYRAQAFNSPFGGLRRSGMGRQNAQATIHEFLTTKSVWCELGDEVRDPFVQKL